MAEKLVSKGADLVGTLVSTTLSARSAGARSLALALRPWAAAGAPSYGREFRMGREIEATKGI